MQSSIRAFKPEDLDDVVQIYAQSKLDELKFEEKVFRLLPLKEDNTRFSALMESTIVVFELGHQKIAGFGAYYEDGGVIEIRGLFVRPEARGKGIGQQLLRHMLALEKPDNMEDPTSINLTSQTIKPQAIMYRLYIATSNLPARNLYEKHGFQSIETFETDYNGQPVMADRMEKLAG